LAETVMHALRRGLAANLRAVPDCTVSTYLHPDPPKLCLSVAGPDVGSEAVGYNEGGFGVLASDRGAQMPMIVEGVVSCAGGLRAAQEIFDEWILWLVPEAIESDVRLTSRLNEDGTITTDQAAACDFLAVREFRGYRRERLGNGTDEFLVGDWVVDVLV
jgi:hypothetical protein